VQLVSKIFNLCDPDPPTSQTDRQTDGRTTCSLNTALYTSASRGKKRALTFVIFVFFVNKNVGQQF